MLNIDRERLWRSVVGFLLGCVALALVTWVKLAFDLKATAGLLYLPIIVLVALTGEILPAIAIAVLAGGCLDFFFLEPRFSLLIAAPDDVIVFVVFILVGVLISYLVIRARRLGAAAALGQQLQVIIDTIPAMVWSHFPDGSAEFVNRRFRDYAGLTAEAGRGSAWTSRLHPEDWTAAAWQSGLAAGEPFEKEARLRSADGGYRRFLFRFVPLRDPQGGIAKWYASSTDIEDLKRAEEELRQREANLREAQAELAHVNRVTTAGQLAASIGHEVAQPVAASLTNANTALRWLAADPPELEETRLAVGRIVRDCRRASDIIGRIRALVRKEPPRRDRFDLNEMVLEVIALTATELRRSGISPRSRLAADLPAVAGDRIQLQQVMLNLILNAVEAMSGEREQSSELLVTTEQDGPNSVCVAVCDSGPGVPPDKLGSLFEAFYTTKQGGMGMGLSICRSIVEAHGGRIWAQANQPRGAVFQFTLPAEAKQSATSRAA